jgi:hypothetical protein
MFRLLIALREQGRKIGTLLPDLRHVSAYLFAKYLLPQLTECNF